MGRPKAPSTLYRKWEARITPTDSLEIVFNPLAEDYRLFLAAMEGGEGTDRKSVV
jgi:hypothetical protein